MASFTIPPDCNYIEIVMKNMTRDLFLNKLQGMCKRNYKYFEKGGRCYVKGLLTYENTDNKEIRVFKKNMKLATDHADHVVCYYDKEKLPYHAYPSTQEHDCIFEYKRLVFRIHNRIYINFEIQDFGESAASLDYRIFVNYNHEQNVDVDHMTQLLTTAIDVLS